MNRYLIYSTHVPLDLDTLSGGHIGFYAISFTTTYLQHSIDDFRRISNEGVSINASEVVFMASNPSLIYSSKIAIFEEDILLERFQYRMKDVRVVSPGKQHYGMNTAPYYDQPTVSTLQTFLHGVITGERVAA